MRGEKQNSAGPGPNKAREIAQPIHRKGSAQNTLIARSLNKSAASFEVLRGVGGRLTFWWAGPGVRFDYDCLRREHVLQDKLLAKHPRDRTGVIRLARRPKVTERGQLG
jgi:hypothetical protein